MYCPKCGKPAEASVRFCPNCGEQIGSGYVPAGAPYAADAYPAGKLVRPRYPRMIGGVCSAFALQFRWDLTLVRVVTAVLGVLTSGAVGIAYLVAWVIIPEAPYALPTGAVDYQSGYGAATPPAPAATSAPPPPPVGGTTI